MEKPKYIYSPVYVQILLLVAYFYKNGLQQMNINVVVERVLSMADSFQCDSELSRIIVTFSHLLSNQIIGEEVLVRGMLDSLPEFVRRLCKIRQDGDSPENDFDIDD